MPAGAHLLSRWTGSTSITLSNNGETRAGCYGGKNHLDFILVLWTIHNLNLNLNFSLLSLLLCQKRRKKQLQMVSSLLKN